MKKMTKIGLLVVLLFAYVTIGESEEGTIPQDLINIKQPSDMPKEITQYIGIWEGNLENGRSIRIIIEDIKDGRVTALYEWGPHSWEELGIQKSSNGGWKRMDGSIEKSSKEGNVRVILQSGSHGVTMETDNGKIAYGKSISGGGKWSNQFTLWKRGTK